MSVQIPLTQGKVALIDEADYPYVAQFKWYAHNSRGKFYAARQTRVGPYKQKRVFLHIELMQPPDGMQVEHISGDSLDCRRENMRHSTQAENNRNKGRHRNAKNPYVGVFKMGPRYVSAPWRAYIGHEGKVIHLGYFSTPEEARDVRDAKARELHGEFARMNGKEQSR